MNDEIKKSLVELACEIKYGPAYLYVRPSAWDYPMRFYFNIAGSSRMWNAIKSWRRKGFLVSIWRPKN
jgi:hypothetical protein